VTGEAVASASGPEAPFFAPAPEGREPTDSLGPPSLASSRPNGVWVGPFPENVRWSGCERRQIELRDAASDKIYLAGCGAWVCPVCGPERASRLSELLAWTRPTTFGRLSLMPDDFQRTREQIRDLRRRLTDRFGVVEWAWVRHRNPKLTGYHVHFLGRMPFIPQRELQAMTGDRIPWISKVRQELGSSDYLLGVRERRGASGYLLKRPPRPDRRECDSARP